MVMGLGQPATASSPVNNKVLRAGREPRTSRASLSSPCEHRRCFNLQQKAATDTEEREETLYYGALPAGLRLHEALQTCQTGSNNARPGSCSVTGDTSTSFPQLQVSKHKRGEEFATETLPRTHKIRFWEKNDSPVSRMDRERMLRPLRVFLR